MTVIFSKSVFQSYLESVVQRPVDRVSIVSVYHTCRVDISVSFLLTAFLF